MKSIPAYVGSALLAATMSVANAGETPQTATVAAPVSKPVAAVVSATQVRHRSLLSNSTTLISRAIEGVQDRTHDISMMSELPVLSTPVPRTAEDAALLEYSGSGVHGELTEQMRLVAGNSRGLRLGLEWNLSSTSPKHPNFRSVTLGVGITKQGAGFILNGKF